MVRPTETRFRGATLLAVLTAGSACGAGGDPAGDVGAGDPDRRYEGSFTVLESADHGPELCVDIAASMPPQCRGLPVLGWDWEAVAHEETVGGTTWGAGHVTGTYDGERFTLTEPPGPPQPDEEAEPDPDPSPACDEPDVVDPSHGVAGWEAMSQDHGPFEIPGLVAAWVSDPAGDGDGSFVGNVVVVPGAAPAALARIREHYAGPLWVVERDVPTADELTSVRDELLDGSARVALGQPQDVLTDERRGVVVVTVWVADEAAVAYAERRWGDLVQLDGLLRPA
jgi:hypothetical protein